MPQLFCGRKLPLDFLLILSLSSLFSGCAHVPQVRSTVVVKAAAVELLEEEGKSFAFVAAAAGKLSPNRPQYQALIEKHLMKNGWHRLPDNSTDADYIIEFRHTQSVKERPVTHVTRRSTFAPPVSLQQNYGGPGNPGGPTLSRPAKTALERSTSVVKIDRYTVTLKIKRPARSSDESSLEVWSISVYGNTDTKQEDRVVPAMIEASFKNFPGVKDRTYFVSGSAE